jgi:hypothetical protein
MIPGSKLTAFARSRDIGISVSAWNNVDNETPLTAEPLRGVWLDEQGAMLGEEIELDPVIVDLAEGFAPDGVIGAEPVARAIDLPTDRPDGASLLQLLWGNDRLTLGLGELVRAQSMPGPPVVRNFPDDHRASYYPVFSDGFLDVEEFFAHVADLIDWIRTHAPFDTPPVEPRFGMKGHFWRAPGPGISHFGAPLTGAMICAVGGGTPVLLGSRENAARLVGGLMSGGQGLILMNSSQRGGAGGSAPHKFPAWASINACPGEDWRKIALHEMGHSLGLEDEYVLPDLPVYAEWRNAAFASGPNATSEKNPARTPWKNMLNLGGDADRPTVGLDEQTAGWVDPEPNGKALIGTIAGAHYHEKYFRPSGDCLMRSLAVDHFCAVCQKHIVAQLG